MLDEHDQEPNGDVLVNTTWSATKPMGMCPAGARAYGQSTHVFAGTTGVVSTGWIATNHDTKRPKGSDGGSNTG